MILSLFTVRNPGHYHQIHRTYENDDLNALILIGNAWMDDARKQYYQITDGPRQPVSSVDRREITPYKSTSCEIRI